MLKEKVLERFLNYAKIYTTSDEESQSFPSTKRQLDLAVILEKELKQLGLENVRIDENGYVWGCLKGNKEGIKSVGFVAHMDTSPDLTGENVNPQIHQNYDGSDIVLNKENNIVLSPKEYPDMLRYKGQTLITTDGKTLLGADDKAGIAEIITGIEYLSKNKDIKRGDVWVCFTPDEEIGRGADKFEVKNFPVDFAYTLDGAEIGEIQFENFNAAYAKISVKGKSVHTGTAKGIMKNAATMAMELHNLLPENETPEATEGYEGFYHLLSFEGSVEEAKLYYLIRDFAEKDFEDRKVFIQNIVEKMQGKYSKNDFILEMKDQYYNMKEKIEPVMHVVEIPKKAMQNIGVEPIIRPIRGGTDGARISFMGIPTPNLFAGGHNFHGRYEFVPVESMEKASELIVEIVKLIAVE